MPTLRREAQSTSALEGTYAPLEEVLAADVIERVDRSAALTEVMNYVEAADNGFDWVTGGRPITAGLICDLHGILVHGTSAQTQHAGRIRGIPVAIGSAAGSFEDSRFVPMPPGLELEAAVSDLFTWMRADGRTGEVDPIVAAAMVHYQFESLRPFNDGNGRLGRLLVVLHFLQDEVIAEPLLSVSPWFEARRGAYQDRLAAVSAQGAWDPWVAFFCEGIEAAAIDTARRVDGLLDSQNDYQERLRAAKATGMVRDIADLLIGTPYVTVRQIQRTTGKTYQAASNAINRLVELGILRETTGRGQNRVFRADAMIAVLTHPT